MIQADELRRAIYGADAANFADEDEYHLLWRVGEMRREAVAAHARLDLKDVPRGGFGQTFTLRGRIDHL